MAQILSTLDSCLGTKPGLNFAEFEILTESRCSDIFLSVTPITQSRLGVCFNKTGSAVQPAEMAPFLGHKICGIQAAGRTQTPLTPSASDNDYRGKGPVSGDCSLRARMRR